MLKNLSKMRHYLPIFVPIFLVKKQIVYLPKKFSIQSLFVLIQFEIDRIVHDRLNIAVT
jgi:hypothetical protein